MTQNDLKNNFSFFILFLIVLAFVLSFLAENYIMAILFIVGGITFWMLYLNLAKVRIHRQTGAILIIFGVLLFSAVFMAYGVEQDIWGGYRLNSDGVILSLIILFFAVMPGLIFYYIRRPQPPTVPPPTALPSIEKTSSPEVSLPSEKYPGFEDYEYYYDPEMAAAYYEDYEEEEEEEDEE